MPDVREQTLPYTVSKNLVITYFINLESEGEEEIWANVKANVTFSNPQGPLADRFGLQGWSEALGEANRYENITNMMPASDHYNAVFDDGLRTSYRFRFDSETADPNAGALQGRGALYAVYGPDINHQSVLTDEDPLATVDVSIEFQDDTHAGKFLEYVRNEI